MFHDSWNAFPTFALLDHTMTVRAKPWTLDNNSNTSSCDGTNQTINGWSGGSTSDFIQQLIEECGPLCEECSGTTDSDGDGIADECDDCNNMSGDTNDDMTIDILDIVTVVNMILTGGVNSPDFTDCEKSDGDFDSNGTINILDVIQIINIVLGNSRMVAEEGYLDATYDIIDNDMLITLSSDVSLSGVEIGFYSDYLLGIEVNDNENRLDLYSGTDMILDIQKYVVFSMDNVSFDSNTIELLIEDGATLDIENMNIIAGTTSGKELPLRWNASEVQNFKLDKVSPNPFNPSTQISYAVDKAGYMTLSVYNIAGQVVSTLFDGYQTEGSYNVLWNASEFASGVYYISMFMEGHVETMKAVLVK